MSVAFRRESDEEHKEPRFELPIPPGPNLVTRRGLALIEARVSELEGLVHDAADEAETEAVRRDLRYWRTRLATAQLAPPPPAGQIGLGSRVTFLLNGNERVVEIVGDDEAEPPKGRLSFSAPLSRALMGGEVGELLDFAGKPEAIEVVTIEPLDGDAQGL